MIKIFLRTDRLFTSQGEGTLRPISCKETKVIAESWYVEVEADLSYLTKLVHDNIVVVPTVYGNQPFRIVNPEVGKTIKFKAHHVGYDTKNYVVDDTSSLAMNCASAMSWVIGRTTPNNAFSIYSDIRSTKTVTYSRNSLYESMQMIAAAYGGFLDFDGWQIRITSTLGSDKGVELRYGKNLESALYTPDWSEVVTQLKPIGNNGLVGSWLASAYSYSKPYAKVVEFDANDAPTLTALATAYLTAHEIPKVNYEVRAKSVSRNTDYQINTKADEDIITNLGEDALLAITSHGDVLINDTIEVFARQFTVLANVLSYQRNSVTGLYLSVEFGNYRPTVQNMFSTLKSTVQATTLRAAQVKIDEINGEILLKVSKDDVVNQINLSTEGITISANKITLEGIITANSYFKINLDGSMEATNGKFSGEVTATSGSFTGAIHAGSGTIANTVISSTALTHGDFILDFANDRIYFKTGAYFYGSYTDMIRCSGRFSVDNTVTVVGKVTAENNLEVDGTLQVKFGATVYSITRDANGFLKAV